MLGQDDSGEDLKARVRNGLGLITGEAHGEGISAAPSYRLHVMFVLNPAGEGGDSTLSGLDGSVRFKVLVDKDKSAPCEVSLVV